MFKSLIAGITALSLTFASATPTYADGMDREDIGKLLIGLAAIAALNAALENNNRREERNAPTPQPAHRGINRNNDWSGLNRQHQNSNARWVIPHQCLQTVDTRFGAQRLFGQRCLERNYRQVDRLPDRCVVRLYTTNGPVSGYDPQCLRDQGYRSDRRH